MIRMRAANGRVMPVPEGARFVEILSADERLAGVVWIDDGDVIHMARSGEQDANRYAHAFGIPVARVVDLDEAFKQH